MKKNGKTFNIYFLALILVVAAGTLAAAAYCSGYLFGRSIRTNQDGRLTNGLTEQIERSETILRGISEENRRVRGLIEEAVLDSRSTIDSIEKLRILVQYIEIIYNSVGSINDNIGDYFDSQEIVGEDD